MNPIDESEIINNHWTPKKFAFAIIKSFYANFVYNSGGLKDKNNIFYTKFDELDTSYLCINTSNIIM